MKEYICPLCNDLHEENIFCRCGAKMQDSGLVSNFYGPYSPYSGMDMNHEMLYCRHLYNCPVCGRDKQIDVKLQPGV